MPNKTVYLSDEQVPIWERVGEVAGALGDTISGVVIKELQRYVEEWGPIADELAATKKRFQDKYDNR